MRGLTRTNRGRHVRRAQRFPLQHPIFQGKLSIVWQPARYTLNKRWPRMGSSNSGMAFLLTVEILIRRLTHSYGSIERRLWVVCQTSHRILRNLEVEENVGSGGQLENCFGTCRECTLHHHVTDKCQSIIFEVGFDHCTPSMANPRQRRKLRSSSHKPVSHSRHAKRNLKKTPRKSMKEKLQN